MCLIIFQCCLNTDCCSGGCCLEQRCVKSSQENCEQGARNPCDVVRCAYGPCVPQNVNCVKAPCPCVARCTNSTSG